MLQDCLKFAKRIYSEGKQQASHPVESGFEERARPSSTHAERNVLKWAANSAPSIPRHLQLARSIHARFTKEEEKQLAVYREAESLAARKNDLIMRAVNEVLEFCELLRNVPDFNALLDAKTEDITQRWFSTGCSYTVENEPIGVRYEAPRYRVDMHVPEHVSLTGVDNAYMHISFNPVTFVVHDKHATETSTITKHLLSKQYRITADGTFLHDQSANDTPVDPIAEILTDLRARLGHEFFERNLLPHFEAQMSEHSNEVH
jgi:hypothetical protein